MPSARWPDSTREALLGSHRCAAALEQGDISVLPDGTRLHDQKIETADGRAGSPGATSWLAEEARHAEVQSVGRDVTDRTEAERALAEARDAAEAASRAKSRFLAMVSHEIRTPLNGILGMADLLLDTTLTPEQTTYVKAIKTSGDTLLSLIEEILDFSKIEAGKLDLDARPFALAAWSRKSSSCWRRARRPRAWRSPPMSTSGCPNASSATPRGCARCCSISPAMRSSSPRPAASASSSRPGARPARSVRGARHRHRHRARAAGAHLPRIRTGRRRLGAQVRRHRSGPRDLAAHRRAHGRPHRGRERAGRGSTFRAIVPLAGAAETHRIHAARPRRQGGADRRARARSRPSLLERAARPLGRQRLAPSRTRRADALLPERHWDAMLIDHALGARRPLTRRGAIAARAAHRPDHAGRAPSNCRR